VGLGIGVFAGVRALGLRSDAASHCDPYPSRCSPDASSANSDAKTFATVSTIGFVAGGVFAAGGIALVVLAPTLGAKTGAVRIVPTGRGGAIEGRF